MTAQVLPFPRPRPRPVPDPIDPHPPVPMPEPLDRPAAMLPGAALALLWLRVWAAWWVVMTDRGNRPQ